MASISNPKVSSAPISSIKGTPDYHQPYQPVFPFIRPQIPSSVTSNGLVSQETPTPKPRSRKRKSDKRDKSMPIAERGTLNSGSLGLEANVATEKRCDTNITGNSNRREKRKDKVPVSAAHSADESSSSEESMDLEDFDTTGISREEMELWSECAPQDQQLVKSFKREESPDQQPSRQRRPSGIFPITTSFCQVMPLMYL